MPAKSCKLLYDSNYFYVMTYKRELASAFQGWTKFYEFSLSDLRAGFEIIDRLFEGEETSTLAIIVYTVHMRTANNLHSCPRW